MTGGAGSRILELFPVVPLRSLASAEEERLGAGARLLASAAHRLPDQDEAGLLEGVRV